MAELQSGNVAKRALTYSNHRGKPNFLSLESNPLRYLELTPCSALARYVKCFWVMESPLAASGSPERIVPDGCPEMIVHYADRFTEDDFAGRPTLQPRAIVAGQLTGPLVLRPTGSSGMFAARFHPGGITPFLDAAMHELADRRVPLEAVCGREADGLTSRICEARSDRARQAAFEEFLLARLAIKRRSAGVLPVERCLAAIADRGGQISVRELASLADCGERQLQRLFRESVGVSPKLLCGIIRFRAVFDALQKNPVWSSAALDCGYFDQPHLIHDFQRFAGQSPAAYLAGATDFGKCFHPGQQLSKSRLPFASRKDVLSRSERRQ